MFFIKIANMQQLYYRTISTFLAILGLVVGFSAKVIAQYGAPPAFRFNGKINSAECNLPIKNIQLIVTNNLNQDTVKLYTNERGEFHFRSYDYNSEAPRIFSIVAKDTDGVASGGSFAEKSFTVEAQAYEMKNLDFQLTHLDIPPCDSKKGAVPTGGNDDDFIVYPNTTRGSYTLTVNAKTPNEATFKITDGSGSEIFTTNLPVKKGTQQFTINVDQLTPGMYYFSLIQNLVIATRKIVIQ